MDILARNKDLRDQCAKAGIQLPPQAKSPDEADLMAENQWLESQLKSKQPPPAPKGDQSHFAEYTRLQNSDAIAATLYWRKNEKAIMAELTKGQNA